MGSSSTAQTQRIFGGARILVRSDFWVTLKSALLFRVTAPRHTEVQLL